jgi:hypothetical protein
VLPPTAAIVHHAAVTSNSTSASRVAGHYRLGVALLAVVFVALAIVAAAIGHPGDAVFFAIAGVIVVSAAVICRRFLVRWIGRRGGE